MKKTTLVLLIAVVTVFFFSCHSSGRTGKGKGNNLPCPKHSEILVNTVSNLG